MEWIDIINQKPLLTSLFLENCHDISLYQKKQSLLLSDVKKFFFKNFLKFSQLILKEVEKEIVVSICHNYSHYSSMEDSLSEFSEYINKFNR